MNDIPTPQLKHKKEWLAHLLIEKGLSKNSLTAYRQDIEIFEFFINKTNTEFKNIDEDILLHFAVFLKKQGNTPRTLARRFSTLRSFFSYCNNEEYIDSNPAIFLDSPKFIQELPYVLSTDEIRKMIECAKNFQRKSSKSKEKLNTNTHTFDKSNMRNALMLECFYAAGLRVSELINLRLNSIDFSRLLLKTHGKGDKDRLVPLYSSLCGDLQNYIKMIRPLFSPKEDFLFLNRSGKALTRQYVWKMIQKYAELAGIKENISPHTFRHSFASHLLENGADLRSVQLLLGHSDLTATQIYTHIQNHRLEKVIKNYHIRSKI